MTTAFKGGRLVNIETAGKTRINEGRKKTP